MLILVGVTVTTAINGNLIGLAKNTEKKYDNEMKNGTLHPNLYNSYNDVLKQCPFLFFIIHIPA